MNPSTVEALLHVPDAESALITALLDTRPEIQHLVPEVLLQVDPGDFWDGHHQELWKTARVIAARGEVVTRFALVREKITAPMLERLDRCDGEYVSYTGIGKAAQKVHEVAYSRRIVHACDRMLIAAAEQNASEALEVVHQEVDALKHAPCEESTSITAALDEYEDWERAPQTVFTPTPWSEVNDLFNGGYEPGRLYAFGARPGGGKSIALTNSLLTAAEAGIPVILFSLEMTRREVIARIIAHGGDVNISHLLKKSLSTEEARRRRNVIARLRELPIKINDHTRMTTTAIQAACRAFKREHGWIGLVAVDYLQLLEPLSTKPQRHEQIGQMTRDLKLMAKELDCPVVVACQLNRGNVDRAPRKSDLRESGSIEQDSDVVVLLHRPIGADGEAEDEIEMIVDKNRGGPEGKVTCVWRGDIATIHDFRRN